MTTIEQTAKTVPAIQTARFRSATGSDPDKKYVIFCPACGVHHLIPTAGSVYWEFNGNLEQPTFSPSLRVQGTDEKGNKVICHSQITSGEINYYSDSTHKMAGSKATLPIIGKI